MSILIVALLVIVGPAGIAWTLRKLVRSRARHVGLLITFAAASAPSLWMFIAALQADATTTAAAFYVIPILFLLSLAFAGIGYSLADQSEQSP